jgi:predicted helicase
MITKRNGYFYVRYHSSYEKYNARKMGKASNLIERDSVYATGEIERGFFELVIQVKNEHIIEKLLQGYFNKMGLNIYYDGGTEFYDKKILELIIPYLDYLNVEYYVLSKKEIDNLTRTVRLKNKLLPKINTQKFINFVKTNVIPNEQQINILNICDDFYKKNDISKLVWSCGLGKTLLSILIIKKMGWKNILIGVPSIYLQKQFINEILKIFPNNDNILCVGGTFQQSTTDKTKILSFYKNKINEISFIITTYASCHLLNDNQFKFDFKIGDEAHHLTGLENEETKNYNLFHKIISSKTLFMTATEKTISTKKNCIVYSMENEKIFGNLLDLKSVNWAIENKKITDYNLLILSNTENEINDIIKDLNIDFPNKELFMSAFMSLKAIEKYNDLTHILICCNETENTEIIKVYIDKILDKKIFNIDKSMFYNNAIHSNKKINIDLNDPDNEIDKFKKSKYGIISSVYIFGEGFDLPKLNGVVFAENMISDIRIVQTALRSNRLEYNNPTKKAYIIIPYLEHNDIVCDNDAFNRVRMIISKLRNVDETIEQKINMSTIKKNDSKKSSNSKNEYDYDFIHENHELGKIKLRLKYSKALGSKCSEEQDEYNYVKMINKELNIQSKEQYSEMITKSIHKNYIENPDEYFKLKGVWDNWYDFIGIDTMKFIRYKNEWIEFCKDKKISSNEDYIQNCDIYDCLPKNPVDFYKDFSNVLNELGLIKKRR